MKSAVLLLALVACKRDPDGEGAFGDLPEADVTIVDEGSGDANLEPLQPLDRGYRAVYGQFAGVETSIRWAGAVDAGRDDVYVMEIGSSGSDDGIALYWPTDDGIVTPALGDDPLNPELPPVLVVPETVRLGMEWESDLGDGSVNVMTVIAHETIVTPIGPVAGWAIGDHLSDGSLRVRWYGEGVGRLDSRAVGDAEWRDDMGFTEMVVPSEPQPHVEPALDPVPVTILLEVDRGDYTPYDIRHFSGAVIDGQLWGYLDGTSPASGYTTETGLDMCADLGSAPRMFEGPDFPDAACFGGLVDNAGRLLPGLDTRLNLDGGGFVQSPVLTGWVEDGVEHTLRADESAEGILYLEYPLPAEFHAPPALVDEGLGMPMFLYGDQIFTDGTLWIGPAVVGAGAPVHFAVVSRDGQVFSASLQDGSLSGFVPVGTLPGAVSILLEGDERIAYSITQDGRVFELRVDQADGAVRIAGLGSVVTDPPLDYTFRGVLVDPTHPGDVYVAAYSLKADTAIGIHKGHLEQEAVQIGTTPSLLVAAADFEPGIAICWAPSDEPFDGTGWTLRGEPVDAVGPLGPNGNCALIYTDYLEPIDPQWAGAERAIEAKIPGVGPVRLGYRPRRADPGVNPLATVLNDGTVIDVHGLVRDTHGFPMRLAHTFERSGLRDIGGYGIWHGGGAYEYATDVYNIGGGLPTPECPAVEYWTSCYIGGDVVGGGIVFVSPPPLVGAQVVHGDGSIEELPEAQVYGRRIGTMLEDGRICGIAGSIDREITCTDRDGVTQTTGPIGPIALLEYQLWPLSDGTLLVSNDIEYGPSYRFDPEAMTATPIDSRAMHDPFGAPDGRVYAVATGLDGVSTLVEITDGGIVDISLVDEWSTVLPIEGAFLIAGRGSIPR